MPSDCLGLKPELDGRGVRVAADRGLRITELAEHDMHFRIVVRGSTTADCQQPDIDVLSAVVRKRCGRGAPIDVEQLGQVPEPVVRNEEPNPRRCIRNARLVDTVSGRA